jgi:hypothetical protein
MKGEALYDLNERQLATIATALNDPRRSTIQDPRRGQYAVTFKTSDQSEAETLAQTLRALDLTVQTNYKRDSEGTPIYAFVTLYNHDDQRRLFELAKDKLEFERSEQLQRLVAARGPLPADSRERIRQAATVWGWPAETIATKMNQAGVIAGMGGKHWTAKKIRTILADG